MKILPFFLLGFLSFIRLSAQNTSSDFKTLKVEKKLTELPDSMSMSTPLNAQVNIFNGLLKDRLNWDKVTEEPKRTNDTSIYKVAEEEKIKIRNIRILEVNIYKDSIATVINQMDDMQFNVRWFQKVNNQWYNSGEDYYKTYGEAHEQIFAWGDYSLKKLRQNLLFAAYPHDTLSFLKYLADNGTSPKEAVLKALTVHKLVGYGEIHRRLLSWNLCRSIINDPRFSASCGTIFMEISSHSQPKVDSFLRSKEFRPELILETFRDMTDNGWNDKGMFDFIMDVWKLNQSLSATRKIRIVAVDIARPWNKINNADDLRDLLYKFDRDSIMANIVLTYLKEKKDPRNSMFIVGAAHLCKTSESAGKILARHLSKNEFYTFFTHCPRIENNGNIPGKIRHGMFDVAFEKSGNQPLAFDLHMGRFGKEPFDGLVGDGEGSFSQNYDGYIFLGDLKTEPNGEMLYELYSEDFIKELDRRSYLTQGVSLKESWGITDTTREGLLNYLKTGRSTLRWGKLSD